jgi:hypothetical protein
MVDAFTDYRVVVDAAVTLAARGDRKRTGCGSGALTAYSF